MMNKHPKIGVVANTSFNIINFRMGLIKALIQNGYDVVIIADHGNADYALNEDGSENTAHSLNPVPFIWVTDQVNAKVSDGILADVAPTLLKIMGLAIPSDMTGNVLIQ